MFKLIFLFTTIITFNYSWAQDKAFMSFGGGCGNNTALSRFKNGIEETAKANGHRTYSSFSNSEKSVADPASSGNINHLKAELEKAIADFGKKDCNKEHCQFIFHISTHGYPGDVSSPVSFGLEKEKKVGHAVCLANNTKYYVSDLKPYFTKLKEKGVKIGVIDESCFSGGSANELGDVACVLTATSSFIPNTAPDDYASFSKSTSENIDAGFKNPSFEDLMIGELVGQTGTGMKNVPLMKYPAEDKVMAGLNAYSEFFGYLQNSLQINKAIYATGKMDLVKFSSLIKECHEAFVKANGIPPEAIKSQEWYIEFQKDPVRVDVCRFIPIVRNHHDKLAELKWDEDKKSNFVGVLKSCDETNSVLDNQNKAVLNTLSDVSNFMIKDMEPNLKELGFQETDITKLFTDINFESESVKKLAKQYKFDCKAGFNNHTKPYAEFKAYKREGEATQLSIHLVNINDISAGFPSHKDCFNFCLDTIKLVSKLKSRLDGDQYVASNCLNKIKALHLIRKKAIRMELEKRIGANQSLSVEEKKLKLKGLNSNTCEQIKM
jgi:hypothetical protein